jgi:hypothetical protein
MACGGPGHHRRCLRHSHLVEGRAGLAITPRGTAKDGCHQVASQLSWDRLAERMEGYYSGVLARN